MYWFALFVFALFSRWLYVYSQRETRTRVEAMKALMKDQTPKLDWKFREYDRLRLTLKGKARLTQFEIYLRRVRVGLKKSA